MEDLILYEWEAMEQMLVYETRRLEQHLLSRTRSMIEQLKANQDEADHFERRMLGEWKANAVRRVKAEAERRLAKLGYEARNRMQEKRYPYSIENALQGHLSGFERKIEAVWDQLLSDVEKAHPEGEGGTHDVEALVGVRLRMPILFEAQQFLKDMPAYSTEQEQSRVLEQVKARADSRQERTNERLRVEQRMMRERLARATGGGVVMAQDDSFLRECEDFNGSSFVARLALSRYSKLVSLPRIWTEDNAYNMASIARAVELNTTLSFIDCGRCNIDDVIMIVHSLSKATCITLQIPSGIWRPSHDKTNEDTGHRYQSNLEDSAGRLADALRGRPNILSITPLPNYRPISEAIEDNRHAARIALYNGDAQIGRAHV